VLDTPLLDPEAAIVIYKGGRHLPAIVARLEAAGRIDGAVFGELLGLPGERVGRLGDAPDGAAAYLASIVVPPSRRSSE
jgi:precorrin-2/cobalt-factor-2 C20-methyltransferase